MWLINCDKKTAESPRQSIIIRRERDHTFHLVKKVNQSEHSTKTCVVKTIDLVKISARSDVYSTHLVLFVAPNLQNTEKSRFSKQRSREPLGPVLPAPGEWCGPSGGRGASRGGDG